MSLLEAESVDVITTETTRYLSPRLEVLATPSHVTSFDGFKLHGVAEGTEVEGCLVEATIAGVTRCGRVADGRWQIRFEHGSLARKVSGVASVTLHLTDRWHNTVTTNDMVMIEEFVDSFVGVDQRTTVRGILGSADAALYATGELALGTHTLGRELVVVLVTELGEDVVSTGIVAPGWHYGEWRAHLPLHGVKPGRYRVRVILTDDACGSLTRQDVSQPFDLA